MTETTTSELAVADAFKYFCACASADADLHKSHHHGMSLIDGMRRLKKENGEWMTAFRVWEGTLRRRDRRIAELEGFVDYCLESDSYDLWRDEARAMKSKRGFR